MRVLVALLLVTVAAPAESWLCARGNPANTGVVKNRGPVRKPQVKWTREEKDLIGTGAALAEGKLIYGVGEFVVACRLQSSGLEVWDATIKQQISAWPAVGDGRMYCGSPDRVHYVFNMKTGKEAGGAEAQAAIVADPVVTEDYYLAGATDGFFYAMAAKNARVLWKRETGPIRHGAAAARSRTYVANASGTLYAFDLKKGREIWKYDAGSKPIAAPILAKSAVLLPLVDAVQLVKTRSGTPGTRYETAGIAGAPVLARTHLHYGTREGEIVTLDIKTGKEMRRTKVASAPVSTPLILASKVLYGAAGKTLFAVAPMGKVLWTFEGEDSYMPPIVADKALYVAAGNIFYCLR